MPLEAYELPGNAAFWCEWNHIHEAPRTLQQIMSGFLASGWGRLIRPGSTCIDIGAHSGDTTIPMAILCGDYRRNIRGSVFAIEPNPDVFAALEINLTLNQHLCRFEAYKLAITKDNSNQVMISDHGNANCNGGIIDDNFSPALQRKLLDTRQHTFVARSANLETFYRECLSISDQRNLSFIKIDCAGYDKEILRSSKGLLSSLRPTIYVDWFDLFSEADSEDLFRAIEDIGYIAYETNTQTRAHVGQKLSELLLLPK